ncbi:MAG: FAD:protein FMN transferase [Planctomycetota bacterium]|nr:FAD:protein FMN transferase [Planctomycetota bacterium]
MQRFIVASHVTLLLFFSTIAANAETLTFNGETMGTYYAITIDSAAETARGEIQAQIDACLMDINRQMSTWDPESEISKFNKLESTDWFPVSPEFAMVVTESIRIHKLTQGAFDPTVAPLIDLWGFGAKRPKSFPTQEAIDAARSKTGMQYIEARVEIPSIRRTHPGITLNLSAIAKGHGVDRVSELLVALGYPSHVVDIGGEDRTGIAKANGQKWRLGVESPLGELQRVIECTEQSVATSGDYRNYFEIKGVRYSHAIDPTTGRPVINPPASVSVLSDSCMTADGLATGLMVMGTEKGFRFAKEHKLSVLYLDVIDKKTIVEHATGEFLAAAQTAAKPASSEPSGGQWIPFVAALVVFLLAVTGMAIGVLAKKPALKGSCGGLASLHGQDGKSICELCTIPKDQCTNPDVREKLNEGVQERGNA